MAALPSKTRGPAHGLGLGEDLEALDAALAADSGALVAAERCVGAVHTPPLMPSVPVRIRRSATPLARSRSPDVIIPRQPVRRVVGDGNASSSPSGMMTSTGPKISSRAMVMPLSTSPNSVGSTKKPFGRWAGTPPPVTSRAPRPCPSRCSRAHGPVACGDLGPWRTDVGGVAGPAIEAGPDQVDGSS